MTVTLTSMIYSQTTWKLHIMLDNGGSVSSIKIGPLYGSVVSSICPVDVSREGAWVKAC